MIYRTIFKRRAWGKLKNKEYMFRDFGYLLLDLILFVSIYAFAMEENTSLAGMSLCEIATYLVFSLTFYEITQMNGDKLASKVYKGSFFFEFLKPYSYRGKVLVESAADFIIGCITKLIPMLLLWGIIGYIQLPFASASGVLFIFALLFGAIIWCNVELLLQLIGFWSNGIYNVFFIMKTAYLVFGGGLVLYCFMPQTLCNVLRCTPLYYIIAFPMDIYFGNVNSTWTMGGVFIQFGWIILLVCLEKMVFQAGKRKLQRAD